MPLYPYQQTYIENMPKNVIMAADVGLGKGQMALEHYQRHSQNAPLLIVAPASKVREGGWVREFTLAGLPEAPVISYEKMASTWREHLSPDLVVIFDECHFLCNATSKRSKAAQALASVAHQWIGLSATPLPNGWRSAEGYAVMTGLSKNKTQFHQRFVITDRSRGFPLFLGYREEPTLTTWFTSFAKPLRRTGELVLPSASRAHMITMKPGLSKEYQRVKKERIYQGEMLDSAPKLFATLRQMTTPARMDAIESIVGSTDEHIVIFYNYNVEREAIIALLAKRFKDRPVYEQSGHASHLPPREEWSTIEPSVTLAQYQSASQAIELTYASVTIYMSPTYSYSNFEQSLGRTRRNGQEKTTLFYMLNVEGSLDGMVWKALKAKTSFSEKMMQNSIDNLQ